MKKLIMLGALVAGTQAQAYTAGYVGGNLCIYTRQASASTLTRLLAAPGVSKCERQHSPYLPELEAYVCEQSTSNGGRRIAIIMAAPDAVYDKVIAHMGLDISVCTQVAK